MSDNDGKSMNAILEEQQRLAREVAELVDAYLGATRIPMGHWPSYAEKSLEARTIDRLISNRDHQKAELALQTVICYDEDHAVHRAAEAFLLSYFQ